VTYFMLSLWQDASGMSWDMPPMIPWCPKCASSPKSPKWSRCVSDIKWY
jgi:hypothetical protein